MPIGWFLTGVGWSVNLGTILNTVTFSLGIVLFFAGLILSLIASGEEDKKNKDKE